MSSFQFRDLSENDVVRLADEMAFFLQPGDTLCLEGDLGAGKSTFARALIRALAGDAALDVPSPTFTLTQIYETPRFEVAHFDLYRLTDPDEIDELGLETALKRGVAVIEWPSRGGDRIPQDSVALLLEEGDEYKSFSGTPLLYGEKAATTFTTRASYADELVKIYRQVPADLVNIIEYNPIEAALFSKPDENAIEKFMHHLEKNKVNARLRRSRGKDIDAACGQLANKDH